MAKQLKIALSGKNRSGKDSLCKALVESGEFEGGEFNRFAFAAELKIAAAEMINEDENHFFDEANKIRHRKFLIALGGAGRAYDPLYWVNKTLHGIQCMFDIEGDDWVPVITDLRFSNEARALREAGFLLVRVNCPDEVRLNRGGIVLDDPSETDLDSWPDWDLVLDSSTASPTELAAIVRNWLTNVKYATAPALS